MHILIAPNAFKNSLEAAGVAAAIDEGLKQSNLGCTTKCFPVGDGGDGTGALLVQHLNGVIVKTKVHDPLGRKIHSQFGWMEDEKTAVIEMADASGLRLLKTNELDPLRASSFGTGELIGQAMDRNAHRIIICIGGSATVDGGVGILRALGFRLLDEKKNELTNLPEELTKLDSIELSNIDSRVKDQELILLCDVENPLLGAKGAAAVFGPQKGASDEDVTKLEASLKRLSDIILRQAGKDITGIKHGGAAGGVAATLTALLNAKAVNGIDQFLSLTRFDDELKEADLVITGEGSIDAQTLQGKGPFGVARKARERKIPVIGLAGKIPLEIPNELREYFDVLLPINNGEMDLDEAMKNTRSDLMRTAGAIGDILALKK